MSVKEINARVTNWNETLGDFVTDGNSSLNGELMIAFDSGEVVDVRVGFGDRFINSPQMLFKRRERLMFEPEVNLFNPYSSTLYQVDGDPIAQGGIMRVRVFPFVNDTLEVDSSILPITHYLLYNNTTQKDILFKFVGFNFTFGSSPRRRVIVVGNGDFIAEPGEPFLMCFNILAMEEDPRSNLLVFARELS
jgi:hypothetical protein